MQRVARIAELKGGYTRLSQDEACVLGGGPAATKAELDFTGMRWRNIGKPGGWSQNHLE